MKSQPPVISLQADPLNTEKMLEGGLIAKRKADDSGCRKESVCRSSM
jgi:hypothetical protein